MTVGSQPKTTLPLLLAAILALASAPTAGTTGTVSAPGELEPAQAGSVVVDGSANPERISDYRAYSLLFRFISNRFGNELAAIRAYLRQIRMGGELCATCPTDSAAAERQIDNFIAAGEEFSSKVRNLDMKIKELSQNAPDSAEIERLRKEKERICGEIVQSLVKRLGVADAEKVRLHVQGMKRKMKIVEH